VLFSPANINKKNEGAKLSNVFLLSITEQVFDMFSLYHLPSILHVDDMHGRVLDRTAFEIEKHRNSMSLG
jgi:hypothetical protein